MRGWKLASFGFVVWKEEDGDRTRRNALWKLVILLKLSRVILSNMFDTFFKAVTIHGTSPYLVIFSFRLNDFPKPKDRRITVAIYTNLRGLSKTPQLVKCEFGLK